MHILFICRAFHNMAGGIEFSSSLIMNDLIARGHRVSLITWDQKNPVPFFPLSEKIDWRVLDLGDPWGATTPALKLKRLLKMRKYIKALSPDVMVAFHDDCFMLSALSSRGLGIPLIAAERCAPNRFDHDIKGTKHHILNLFMRLADQIIVFFDIYKDKYHPALRSKMTAIPNMIFPVSQDADPGSDANPKRILYIGRLAYQKNPLVLIKAFAELADRYPDWILEIAGDGPELLEVEASVKMHHLENKVVLHGVIKDVKALYHRANIFCFPSRWEGFGNALAEAIAHGLPCVGFSECIGLSELIAHGKSGLLAPGNNNPQTLAAALETLMKDADLRARYGAAAQASIGQFAPQVIFDKWEQTILQSAGKR